MTVDDYFVQKVTGGTVIVDKVNQAAFWIRGKEEMHLIGLSNKSDKTIDITIPRTFPSGHRIDVINHDVLRGEFGKITIQSGIKIDYNAFSYSKVDEVVWPDDEETIPACCFKNSRIRRLSNIKNVKTVCDEAFSHSGIEEVVWPDLCKIIPNYCFALSDLEKISNLKNVESIGREAFFKTDLDLLDLSETNILFLDKFSLSGIPAYCEVIPPYYISQKIWEGALASEA